MSAPDRAGQLAARAGALGVALDAEAAARLCGYLDAMLDENRRLNLTGVRDRATAEVLHALDGVAFGLTGIVPRRALDLGSGNGFPGVALAVLFPDAEITLLERTAKKARALERLLAAAGLANARVLHADAGQLPGLRPELRGSWDVVTARAVAAPEQVAALAAPLLAPDGRLVLWLDERTEPHGSRDLDLAHSLDYALPAPAARRRRLAVFERRPRRAVNAPAGRG